MKQKKKTKNQGPMIIITTGGSGGHIFPAEAIAGALLRQGARVAFLTDKRGQAFQGLHHVPVYRLMAESVTGRSALGKMIAAVKLLLGSVQAFCLMYRLKPAVVVGVGGYASIPAVMAAHMARIPVVLHEQNAILGRANRMLARGCRLIATSFQPTLRIPGDVPQVQVGLPVRPAVMAVKGTPYVPMKRVFHLLVFGGSQGARFFTTRLPEAILALPADVRAKIDLVQQVRPEDMERAHAFYDQAGLHGLTLKSFFTDMPERLEQAHLVIGRGGAGTLTELMVVGRPAIIVPLPTAADGHQAENARLFCDKGAGWLVEEGGYNPRLLAERLHKLIREPDILTRAAELAAALCPADAAEKMASVVLDIARGNAR